MAGQPSQNPEDNFLDQFFSLTNSLSAGGRPSGDQPFSLALSLDAAADASGSRGSIGDDADKAERDAMQLPGLFPPVFGGGLQPQHLRPSHPPHPPASLPAGGWRSLYPAIGSHLHPVRTFFLCRTA